MNNLNIIERIKNNFFIFFLAILLAFSIFYTSKSDMFLEASVLNINEIKKIQENQRDVAYKNTDGVLDIFISEKLKNLYYDNLDISIIYDYRDLKFDSKSIEFQGSYEIINEGNGEMLLKISNLENIDTKNSLLVFAFSGNSNDILISKALGKKDELLESLSVGNLTEYMDH